MAKKVLATIEASNGDVISLSIDQDGRIWHTVAKTGSQFMSGILREVKTEEEAIKAIRESWGNPEWKLKFVDEVQNPK